MRKEWLSLFYALTYLSFTLKDKYLVSKLKYKISQLWLAMFDFEKNNVAHSGLGLTKLCYLLSETEELVDFLIHFQVTPLSPALQAQKHLLEMRLKLFDKDGHSRPPALEKKSGLSTPHQNEPHPPIQKYYDLSAKILELVKERGSCQTREIVQVFKNDFAPRTVQRYIQQLANAGRLKKQQAGIRNVYTLAENDLKR